MLRLTYLNKVALLRDFPCPTTAMAKRVTGGELNARAKANGCWKGVHRDEDSLQDQNKHVSRVKICQNAILDRYV